MKFAESLSEGGCENKGLFIYFVDTFFKIQKLNFSLKKMKGINVFFKTE